MNARVSGNLVLNQLVSQWRIAAACLLGSPWELVMRHPTLLDVVRHLVGRESQTLVSES